jgi:hypothetical protein
MGIMQSDGQVTVELAKATVATFEQMIGNTFTTTWNNETPASALTLVSASRFRPDQAEERPFSLIFEGPSEPSIPQQIVKLTHGEFHIELFIVPISDDMNVRRYQAVFN